MPGKVAMQQLAAGGIVRDTSSISNPAEDLEEYDLFHHHPALLAAPKIKIPHPRATSSTGEATVDGFLY